LIRAALFEIDQRDKRVSPNPIMDQLCHHRKQVFAFHFHTDRTNQMNEAK